MNGIDIQRVINIALEAGKAILDVYQEADFDTTEKSDSSPLTRADIAAHNIIVASLRDLTPDIVIISEEGKIDDWSTRSQLTRYWLIDPLDGTKEFIKRNGEFTVNIALIEEHVAVLGVVYAPAKDILYYGSKTEGAYKRADGQIESINVKPHETGQLWKVVGSRSHQSEEFKTFVSKFDDTEIVSLGSSLKLCMVAEGAADLYPRLGPTSEWDTAAAQAIVEAAGGQVINYDTMEPLQYNTKDSLLNPYFVVCAEPTQPWYNEPNNANDIVWHEMAVCKSGRAQRFKQKPSIIWFTGLSGSGKSTSASALEQKLFSLGYSTYLLDGDNVRHGLCSDLGFSDRDRVENIRRVGEVAKLMVDAGQIVLVSFISPFIRERQMVRQMVEPGEFYEVYVNTPIDLCEQRDPKGLYKKARDGQIKNFTGIDSPYEAPSEHEIEINTREYSPNEVADVLLCQLRDFKVVS